jgi:hypothetical protein
MDEVDDVAEVIQVKTTWSSRGHERRWIHRDASQIDGCTAVYNVCMPCCSMRYRACVPFVLQS